MAEGCATTGIFNARSFEQTDALAEILERSMDARSANRDGGCCGNVQVPPESNDVVAHDNVRDKKCEKCCFGERIMQQLAFRKVYERTKRIFCYRLCCSLSVAFSGFLRTYLLIATEKLQVADAPIFLLNAQPTASQTLKEDVAVS